MWRWWRLWGRLCNQKTKKSSQVMKFNVGEENLPKIRFWNFSPVLQQSNKRTQRNPQMSVLSWPGLRKGEREREKSQKAMSSRKKYKTGLERVGGD